MDIYTLFFKDKKHKTFANRPLYFLQYLLVGRGATQTGLEDFHLTIWKVRCLIYVSLL